MKAGKWQDAYTVRARKEGFPARSVYKLEEIQKRFRLIRRGGRILDLGCSPGSWLLYVSRLVGGGGRVVGVDLQPVSIALPSNTEVLCGDILEWAEGTVPKGLDGRFDVVLSDMAPACSGHTFVDVQRSLTLCRAALSLSDQVLRSGGSFVCKAFQGDGVEEFGAEVKGRFARTVHVRPKSVRKASKEVYLVALGKRSGKKKEMG